MMLMRTVLIRLISIGAVALLLWLATPGLVLDQSAGWGLQVSVASYHWRATARHELSGANYGLGVQRWFESDVAGWIGVYRNSFRRWSTYALVAWTPVRVSLDRCVIAAGVVGGLVTGYPRAHATLEPAMAAGLLSLRSPAGDIHFLLEPNLGSASGFVGLQFVVPLEEIPRA